MTPEEMEQRVLKAVDELEVIINQANGTPGKRDEKRRKEAASLLASLLLDRQEGMRKVTVTFSASTYRALEELAQEQKVDMAEALKRAIALHVWLKRAREEGDKILVERDGKMREIVKLEE